jgi:multicomponent Na+:H+ antiporter subunit D
MGLPMNPQSLLVAALLAPLLAALIIPFCGRFPNLREGVTLVAAAALAVLVWSLLPHVLAGEQPQWTAARVLPGLEIAFAIEPLGMLFALVAGSLWMVNSVYSIGYMRANREPRQTGYYAFFALAIAATIALAFARNLFTLFIFYEALTLTTFPLVTHKRTPEAIAAGRIYLGILIGTSMVLLLPAIVWTGVVAGTLDFAPGGILDGRIGTTLMAVLLALYVFGIGKAALMPFHLWLPAAMVAPTPVSALLHAVAVVKAGVFAVLKVTVYIFGVDALARAGTADWLAWAAGFTVIAASLVALRQTNLKKRLAYSTISQLSYVVLATAILTPISAIGAAMHIAAHAFAKITLFFAAGSIYTAAHKTEITELDGIGWRMPWTMGAFAIGALAMIGVPPTAGFLGKWFMLQGAIAATNWLAVGVIVVSTVLNALYFLPIVWRAFLAGPAADGDGSRKKAGAVHGEAPLAVVAPLVFTAVVTVVLFFRPEIPLALAQLMMKG